jgi:hypothetical protein
MRHVSISYCWPRAAPRCPPPGRAQVRQSQIFPREPADHFDTCLTGRNRKSKYIHIKRYQQDNNMLCQGAVAHPQVAINSECIRAFLCRPTKSNILHTAHQKLVLTRLQQNQSLSQTGSIGSTKHDTNLIDGGNVCPAIGLSRRAETEHEALSVSSHSR